MRSVISIIALVFLTNGSLWTNHAFADSEGEQVGHKVELSDVDIIVFCNSHKSGLIKPARMYGKNLFGSTEVYFKNYHRIQCPPYYPSPLYHSIEEQPYERELIKELEYIGEILSKKERERLLNRPDQGRREATILDMADFGYKRSQRNGFEPSKRRYELIRQKLEEVGAKRADDLTPEERQRYQSEWRSRPEGWTDNQVNYLRSIE